jgi:hypothetical protein
VTLEEAGELYNEACGAVKRHTPIKQTPATLASLARYAAASAVVHGDKPIRDEIEIAWLTAFYIGMTTQAGHHHIEGVQPV